MDEQLIESTRNNDLPGVVIALGSGANVNYIDSNVSLENSIILSSVTVYNK